MKTFNHLLDSKHFRKQDGIWFLPNSVKVDTTDTASIIAKDNPVDIDHWYNFEYKVFPKNTCFNAFITSEKINNALHNE